MTMEPDIDDMEPELREFARRLLGKDVLVERRMWRTEVEWVSIELTDETYECWVIRDRDPKRLWRGVVLVSSYAEIEGQDMAAQVDLGDLDRALRNGDPEPLAVAAVARLRAKNMGR